ncbi:MAG: sulfatase-like hydrolase/transferase, partial [Planctomycetota bacterium]
MQRLISAAVLVLVAGLGVAAGEDESRPPNIVVLFADDAGYADFGFQPSAAEDLKPLTPHIDSIAREGARFTSAYMSGCVCSPSRAGLLIGRYQQRFGHEHNIPPGYMRGGMELEEKTVGDRLRALGYATGLVGKWHLGYPPAYHPNRRGFEWFYGLLQGSRSYVPYGEPTAHRVIQENGEATPEGGYVTDRFGDAAVRFIADHREEPFFLFVSFTAPHGPLQPKAEDLASIEGIPKGRRRRYAGLIKSLDDNVGKVLAALAEHGLAEHTLVVFTNDNGGQTQTGADNAPLRGRKGELLEGGIRVPLGMRWPGRIEAGTVIDDPVISLDFLPTFVSAAGGEVPASWHLDGVDLLPRMEGTLDALPERPLFWRMGGTTGEIAMRLGRFKLHLPDRPSSPAAALYDLENDVAEAHDLAVTHPELVASM